MKISVDAMGGDFAPGEIIKGSVEGAREHNVGIIFAGPEDVIILRSQPGSSDSPPMIISVASRQISEAGDFWHVASVDASPDIWLGAPVLSVVASYLPTLTALTQDPAVVLRDV